MKKFLKPGLALLALIGLYLAFGTESHAHSGTAMAGFGFLARSRSWAQAEQDAQRDLSSYRGGYSNYNGYGDEFLNYGGRGGSDFYTGAGDEFLDFGGMTASFAEEIKSAKRFSVTVTSTHTATQNVLFAPGLVYNTNGSNAALIVDGSVNSLTGVTASGSPGSIAQFIAFYRHNPIRILGIKVSSNDATQVSQIATYQLESPDKTNESLPIDLGSYWDENVYKDKCVTLDLRDKSIIFSNQSKFTMPVVASSTTTFTIFYGAALNTHKALERKGQAAVNNIKAAPVIAAQTSAAISAPVPGAAYPIAVGPVSGGPVASIGAGGSTVRKGLLGRLNLPWG